MILFPTSANGNSAQRQALTYLLALGVPTGADEAPAQTQTLAHMIAVLVANP